MKTLENEVEYSAEELKKLGLVDAGSFTKGLVIFIPKDRKDKDRYMMKQLDYKYGEPSRYKVHLKYKI